MIDKMEILSKWTIEDYHKMIEGGILNNRKVELIKGEIVKMSPEGELHHYVNFNVGDYLRTLLLNKALISEAHPITLHDNSEPEPDIAIISFPREKYKNHHPYPEDIYWVIEIADTTIKKDSSIKKNLYAEAKIPEYWLIDLQAKILKVFRYPQQKDYQEVNIYNNGFISPLAFPDMKIAINQLLDT